MLGQGLVINSKEAPVLELTGETIRVLANGAVTGEAYDVMEFQGQQEYSVPLHSHPWNEAYLIIEGEMEVTLAKQATTAKAGYFVNIPSGILHSYRVLSPTIKFIVITNSGASGFFTELAQEIGTSEEDIEKITQIAHRYQVTFNQT